MAGESYGFERIAGKLKKTKLGRQRNFLEPCIEYVKMEQK